MSVTIAFATAIDYEIDIVNHKGFTYSPAICFIDSGIINFNQQVFALCTLNKPKSKQENSSTFL